MTVTVLLLKRVSNAFNIFLHFFYMHGSINHPKGPGVVRLYRYVPPRGCGGG